MDKIAIVRLQMMAYIGISLFGISVPYINIYTGKDLDNTGTVKGEIKLSKIQIVEDVSGGSLSGQNGFPFQV